MQLLYRDDRVAAFAKPSGLSVHRGWDDGPTVAVDQARELLGARVFPVHRLDRATSGVLLFALDAEAAATLGRAFEAGDVDKRYVALVRGVPPLACVVDHAVPKGETGEDGPRVPALTELARLYASEPVGPEARRFSLVEARPRTGRLHQIRRHLKHLSHPVVGDVNYGKGPINRFFRERFGLARLALHAVELRFPHPSGSGEIGVLAPLSSDLVGPLVALGASAELIGTIEGSSPRDPRGPRGEKEEAPPR
jgi:tRNA pseudouridine65 synthase